MATRGGSNIYLCSLRSAFCLYHDLEVTCLWPTFIFSRQIRLFETKCITGPSIQPSRAQCGYYHHDWCTVDWIHWNNLLKKEQDACLEKEAPADWDWAESIPRVSNNRRDFSKQDVGIFLSLHLHTSAFCFSTAQRWPIQQNKALQWLPPLLNEH